MFQNRAKSYNMQYLGEQRICMKEFIIYIKIYYWDIGNFLILRTREAGDRLCGKKGLNAGLEEGKQNEDWWLHFANFHSLSTFYLHLWTNGCSCPHVLRECRNSATLQTLIWNHGLPCPHVVAERNCTNMLQDSENAPTWSSWYNY